MKTVIWYCEACKMTMPIEFKYYHCRSENHKKNNFHEVIKQNVIRFNRNYRFGYYDSDGVRPDYYDTRCKVINNLYRWEPRWQTS